MLTLETIGIDTFLEVKTIIFQLLLEVDNRPTQLLLPATLNVAMSRSKIFQTANRGAVSQWKIVEQLLKKKKNRLPSEQFFIGKRLPDSRFERSLNVTLPRSMSVAKVTEYVLCVALYSFSNYDFHGTTFFYWFDLKCGFKFPTTKVQCSSEWML